MPTSNEINLAIGKSLGFAQCPTALAHGFLPELCWRKDEYIGELPNFCSDLNAMHEVECSLDKNSLDDYVSNLYRYCADCRAFMFTAIYDMSDLFPLIHATSQQRAKAYLRTIGKWKD